MIPSRTMRTLVVMMVVLLVMTSAEGIERRRPLYRRGSTTTTVSPLTDDSEGSESKFKPNGKDLYTVSDSYPVSGSIGSGSVPGSFKSDGDKLTSFSEYTFGSTKLSGGGSDGGVLDGSSSDEESSSFSSFKNHKKASLLPTTNANNKDRKPASGAFDFLNGDYAKPKLTAGSSSHLLDSTSIVGLGGKTKTSSAISSKFSISHPTPSSSKAAGKLAHLDDSTEYDVYASLGHSSGKTKLGAGGKHRGSSGTFPSATGSSFGFEGKVKKVPFKYEDGGIGALAGKTKQKPKLTIDEESFGSGSLASASNHFTGLGSFDSGSFGNQKQPGGSGSSKSKFNFAEPPPLVKSTLSTLKHFGEGLIGNGNGAGRAPYELDSEENYKYGSYFGKGHYAAEESYESSAEPAPSKGKYPKLGVGGPSVGANLGSKFATDFDVKNIKLTSEGGTFGNAGHKLPGTLTKNTSPHHKLPQSAHHLSHHLQHHPQQQQQQPQQTIPHPAQSHAHLHAHTLGNTGSIVNPNPLDFRPKFKLQDVPNLYPADHLGAGIAAKGQIESFLNSEHALKDESLVAQLLGDGSPAGRPHYHQFLKSQEDEKLEKEALRQQIEYLKAQAAKRPLDLGNPSRPPIVSNAQKFRPVRRIPSHVRLGVKAPYPLPRIPHYNDRPYSISFKI
ncbi:uncharacterized protein LOC118505110 isoform X3 [Anopheles stephensi]|uniref:uncharacterized protein LOC118505110 isoform X2 n=1 Tax=Anopheles stephensi TaxID=30069 RepID=UPI0016589AC6|nr:uncharacterized protein LOC118505110 isoform X2 [Anopheles stephensi]XP_035896327.1 uncharacterized protein LOC118505110 isoform X3 [Anopheles stephensi]